MQKFKNSILISLPRGKMAKTKTGPRKTFVLNIWLLVSELFQQ